MQTPSRRAVWAAIPSSDGVGLGRGQFQGFDMTVIEYTIYQPRFNHGSWGEHPFARVMGEQHSKSNTSYAMSQHLDALRSDPRGIHETSRQHLTDGLQCSSALLIGYTGNGLGYHTHFLSKARK